MNYIQTYKRKLEQQTSKSQISSLIFELLILNSKHVANEVRRRWIIGESINGGKIGEYSWEEYAMFKAKLNPMAGGYVDLTLTGSLGENITIRKVGNNQYEVFSTDSKYQKIGRQYGFEEFGLTDRQETEMFEELYTFALGTILNNLWRN